MERADVGGESRLLPGRVLVVLEHGVGLGRVIVHRVAEEEKEFKAPVWLVSDVACEQSIQQVRESRGVLHAGARAEERGAAAAAARQCTAGVHGGSMPRCCGFRRNTWSVGGVARLVARLKLCFR